MNFQIIQANSGELCGGELQCVVWWRFGQAKMEEGGSFCLRVVGLSYFGLCLDSLERDLSDKLKGDDVVGSVLRHSLTECILMMIKWFL